MGNTAEENLIEIAADPLADAVLRELQRARLVGARLKPASREAIKRAIARATELRLNAIGATPTRQRAIRMELAAIRATLASVAEVEAAGAWAAIRQYAARAVKAALDAAM